ncbi:PAS domain-containing sensor histidine kinase [Brevundimonas diminuta]|uniref:PAS domain-containing sensor histidine kinase n=1 Tax=Brevundimonas diminuta TaxID=293 RepID=UPI003207922C
MEEDLADLYEHAPCGYLSLSPDARILKLNLTLASWLGLPAEELVGKPFHTVLSFGGRIAFETHMAPLLRLQGFVNELALDVMGSGGVKLPVIANAAERRGPGGEHLVTRLTMFKAVDRRRYEQDLVTAKSKAEALAAAELETASLREQFIAVLGHDLRNPLAAVASGLRLLERDGLSEHGRLVATEMGASVARAATLIDDVLDFARGRLGSGLHLNFRPVEVSPLLEQVIAEIRTIAQQHLIYCNIAVDQPLYCDAGRLAQLASNLVANAVAHGAPGTPINVEAVLAGGRFRLSVCNQGEPIPESVRDRLFQPFVRNPKGGDSQGLGLGLFIVNEIAEAHGGAMSVRSCENETCFTFEMLHTQRPQGDAAVTAHIEALRRGS